MSAQLILASGSPRRRALLDQLGIRYLVQPADIDETQIPGEPAPAYAERIAIDKAATVLARAGLALPVLGADTIVVLDDEVLGKPKDKADAATMLRRLSGRTHIVMSAVALLSAGDEPHSALSVSRVTFAPLDEAWILAYCATGEPLDKAGAYGVQGHAAARIEWLEGSFYGVMGLPLYETGQLLRAAGFALLPGCEPK